jgi:non-heme Fe2+,alpha-ketoglutarate-dependent halogenase
MFEINKNIRRLTEKEKIQFNEKGYVKSLPVFSDSGVKDLQNLYIELSSRIPKHSNITKLNNWHKASLSFYQICHTKEILDYVEGILGKNFYLWGGQFFSKKPRDTSIVPWHQDAQYWPLSPSKSVTVWLAIYDTDEVNGAMKIISGSHKKGKFKHTENSDENYILKQEVTSDQIDENNIIYMNLRAGEISLHTDALLHGSDANSSDRPRSGLAMRFSPTDVKCDLSVWPSFETQLARGEDLYLFNPVALKPRGEATPKSMQFSKEFDTE